MKKYLVLLFVSMLLVVAPGNALALVMDFEDLATYSPDPFAQSDPEAYNGFSFSGANAYEKPVTDDNKYCWDGTNGDWSIVAWTFGGITVADDGGDEFSLDSMYITTDAEGYRIAVTGFRDGSSVAYTHLDDVIHSYQYFFDFSSVHATTDWDDIDSFLVQSYHPTTGYAAHVCLDDITYNTVPIPGAVWLLGSGLIGLVGIRRRKRS